MRNAFARAMTELAKERDDVCLLSGDIGNRMFDRYKEVAPTRFMNCGIAEANMMSMAAGMGLSGLRPVVYTITPFTTTRCLEQIRTGVAYHESPVVIVGTGSGLSYAELGATHHSLEDLAIIRALPNINVFAPCDSLELEKQLRYAIRDDKPSYIRIGKKGEPDIINKNDLANATKLRMVRDGDSAAIICAGPIINEALKADDELSKENVSVAVYSAGSIEPLDKKGLEDIHRKGIKLWITLEEHYKSGGLGSRVLEWINDNGVKGIEMHRLGIPKEFVHILGNQAYVRGKYGIDSYGIKQKVLEILS